jgi:hypothetical protein
LDESSSRFDFLIEHDFFRKAANTFPDHALAAFNRRLAMPIDAASDAMALFVTHQCGPCRRHVEDVGFIMLAAQARRF